MSKRTMRKYGTEFKHNAVKLYYASGKSYSVLSSELGIPTATLVGWIHSGKYRTSEKGAAETAPATTELEELKRLRKELAIVKEERDILKKAVAIFSLPEKA